MTKAIPGASKKSEHRLVLAELVAEMRHRIEHPWDGLRRQWAVCCAFEPFTVRAVVAAGAIVAVCAIVGALELCAFLAAVL